MNQHINIQNYLNLAENDWDFLGKLIRQSILSLEELNGNYQKAMETHNIEHLRDAIHKIKPTLIILESGTLLAHLEEGKAILSESRVDPAKAYINASLVNQEVREVIKILENHIEIDLSV